MRRNKATIAAGRREETIQVVKALPIRAALESWMDEALNNHRPAVAFARIKRRALRKTTGH